jgi:hypothetical protein
MKTELFTLGSVTALGFGYLFYQKNKPHHTLKLSNTKPTVETFQIIDMEEKHPEQHPEQTMPASDVMCLYQMAADLTYLFDMFGVNAWVSGGALLGAVRHAGLIPWEPVLEFFAYTRDQAALGQLFLTNTLRAYGYQSIEFEGGWMFYMGAQPEVKVMLYWVEPSDEDVTCPSGDLGRNSCDPDCGVSLKALRNGLMKTAHHGYLGSVNEIEPRRKWAFGATEVYVPSQFEMILNKQEGVNWKTIGDDPSLAPPSDVNREYQRMPWYRAPKVLCERDFKPATPIGPLKFADRAITKYSRDIDVKGKYGI